MRAEVSMPRSPAQATRSIPKPGGAADNQRMKSDLRLRLRYPTVREGLAGT